MGRTTTILRSFETENIPNISNDLLYWIVTKKQSGCYEIKFNEDSPDTRGLKNGHSELNFYEYTSYDAIKELYNIIIPSNNDEEFFSIGECIISEDLSGGRSLNIIRETHSENGDIVIFHIDLLNTDGSGDTDKYEYIFEYDKSEPIVKAVHQTLTLDRKDTFSAVDIFFKDKTKYSIMITPNDENDKVDIVHFEKFKNGIFSSEWNNTKHYLLKMNQLKKLLKTITYYDKISIMNSNNEDHHVYIVGLDQNIPFGEIED